MDQAVILFDGICNLCNGAVDFVMQHDSHQNFVFGSLQSDEGRYVLEQVGIRPPYDDSIVLVKGATAYTRSDAVIRIARTLGFPWSLAAAGFMMPKRWRDGVYNCVARNRYGWFGRRDTCRLPTSAERSRFLGPAQAGQSGTDS